MESKKLLSVLCCLMISGAYANCLTRIPIINSVHSNSPKTISLEVDALALMQKNKFRVTNMPKNSTSYFDIDRSGECKGKGQVIFKGHYGNYQYKGQLSFPLGQDHGFKITDCAHNEVNKNNWLCNVVIV